MPPVRFKRRQVSPPPPTPSPSDDPALRDGPSPPSSPIIDLDLYFAQDFKDSTPSATNKDRIIPAEEQKEPTSKRGSVATLASIQKPHRVTGDPQDKESGKIKSKVRIAPYEKPTRLNTGNRRRNPFFRNPRPSTAKTEETDTPVDDSSDPYPRRETTQKDDLSMDADMTESEDTPISLQDRFGRISCS